MKKTTPLLLLAATTVLNSCKKDDECQPAITNNNTQVIQNPGTNYSSLQVGNYWIYQRFQLDPPSTETALPVFDSCYVEKDTLIHGNTYFKYVGYSNSLPTSPSAPTIEFLRDSLDYLVDLNGRIEFSSEDFASYFKAEYLLVAPGDTLAHVSGKMADQNFAVTTPLGNYITSAYKESYAMYPSYNGGGSLRFRTTRYADHVGKVTETLPFFANTASSWERRLVRYHLN